MPSTSYVPNNCAKSRMKSFVKYRSSNGWTILIIATIAFFLGLYSLVWSVVPWGLELILSGFLSHPFLHQSFLDARLK